MNTQQKQKLLKSHIQALNSMNSSIQQYLSSPLFESQQQYQQFNVPKIDLLSSLIKHQQKINAVVDHTYDSVRNVLAELSQLQTRKQNVNNLLDSMTAIKEVKRLAYGLGSSPPQVCRNLTIYYQIKDKLYYCDKYVEKVQEQINKIKQEYQKQLQSQLKRPNSQNIAQLSKCLSLISSGNQQIGSLSSSGNITSSHISQMSHITKFAQTQLSSELKPLEEDLFRIPITAPSNSTSNCYIFFDIAKDVMRIVANMVKNFKGNMNKIGGEAALEIFIENLFGHVMTGIIAEIFVRQKRYFQFDNFDIKKISKDASTINRLKDYLYQFCAIWNQIQRLKHHLLSEIPSTSSLRKPFQNTLNNHTNSKQLLTITAQTSQAIKMYSKYHLNNLLKVSPFVNNMYAIDVEYLNGIVKAANGKSYQSQDGMDFVINTFGVLMKPLQKVFQSLNMLIISPFITFANNVLVQQDSFHAFVQIFQKILTKLPSSESKYYTTIVLLLNTMLLMPGALRNEISSFSIPAQLQSNRARLQSQLKQLVEVCDYRGREVLTKCIDSILTATWFANQLKQDYRKAIQKWKGFTPQLNQLFLLKMSQVHSSLILLDELSPKSKKGLSQQSLISLQKQVRNIINFYEAKGCSAMTSFKRILQFVQIVMAENQESANRLIKKFGVDEDEVGRIWALRALRTD